MKINYRKLDSPELLYKCFIVYIISFHLCLTAPDIFSIPCYNFTIQALSDWFVFYSNQLVNHFISRTRSAISICVSHVHCSAILVLVMWLLPYAHVMRVILDQLMEVRMPCVAHVSTCTHNPHKLFNIQQLKNILHDIVRISL